MRKFITSESVTEGHPDKVCDQISDAILDAMLMQDENSRVACEACATTEFVLVMGEITSNADVDIEKIVRKTIKDIGYEDKDCGFDYQNAEVKILLHKQSTDIAQGVDSSLENKESKDDYDKIGAGDQGMMFGFATNETENYMPLSLELSHKLCEKLAELRKNNKLSYLRPDGKAQVTVEYEDGIIKRVDAVVVSTQHDEIIDMDTLRKDIKKYCIDEVIPSNFIDENTKYYINPTGRFFIGGPNGDSGLTGRKIIVDTYGGHSSHGGGCFSGKDATKVDRSAAYFARYVAKNVVASGLCDKCEIQLAYAIGKAHPVSVRLDTFGTAKVSEEKIEKAVKKIFDFRPMAIIEYLNLKKPQYLKTASYGHFGKKDLAWEKTDKTDEILKEVNGIN